MADIQDRVLSTLNQDGSRRWLRPKLSAGRFLRRRRIVAYSLILFFTAIPHIDIAGKPVVLLDLPARRFTFFGTTLLPTDTLLFTILLVGIFLTVFLATALFGRVWCGWMCPQTVYLEFLYRPIERWTERAFRLKGAQKKGAFGAVKYGMCLAVSLFLAHTFLAYFVGVDALAQWVRRSPLDHPEGFLIVAVVTGLMLFNFMFFREQTCVVACPYGRFQSVMLDRNSLIINYDDCRGEPRGKIRKKSEKTDVELSVIDGAWKQGDCVDCRMCVTTCPTGIDIRDGLQMECIGCAQCIDACDAVMSKIGRSTGLIGYRTQSSMEGGRFSFARPRVFVYATVIAVLASVFFVVISNRKELDLTVLRGRGLPYVVLEDGRVSNELMVKITNRTDREVECMVDIVGADDVRVISGETAFVLSAGKSGTRSFRVAAPRMFFTSGKNKVDVRVVEDGRVLSEKAYTLLGPRGSVPGTLKKEMQ